MDVDIEAMVRLPIGLQNVKMGKLGKIVRC
jgi:hypothetical protein